MARYVYVLIARERDRYATMCLLSALSVRGVDPAARISVLTDEATAARLRANRHRLLEVVDDLLPTPAEGHSGYVSRFLKTSMLQQIKESFVFLDCDTLVLKSLAHRLVRPSSMQMALDRYPGHPSPGFPDWTIPHYQRLNWHYPTARYFNSGVMFVRADAASQRLFDQWHRRWRDFQAATGKIDDQPSLNTAIEVANVEVGVLPVRYNAMVRVKERYRWRARVLHFFTRDYDTDEGTEYHSLIHRVEAGEPISAAEIRTAISRRVPLVEPWSLRRYLHAGGFLSAWRLWRAGAEKRLVRQAQESQVDITSMAGKLLSQPIPPVPCTRRAITTHQQRGQFRASHPQ